MSDQRFMSLALSIGRRGLGRTWPNPSVGCIIVSGDQIIGRGATADGGRPHAEIIALAQAGAKAKGATVYVTLEPCAHTGKTSPCTEALIRSGVRRVVTAVHDQDPRVNGKGIRALKAAGVEVVTGIMADEASYDHRGFFLNISRNRPFLTLKMAKSLDGRNATANGQSKWITDKQSRRLVHLIRSKHDAVMVGGGTARQDDPSLNVRNLGIEHKTVRIVVSSNLNLPERSILAETARQTPLWLCHSQDAGMSRIVKWQNMGAKLILCKGKNGYLDLQDAMTRLASLGLTRVFCEGGGTLAASLIKSDLVDELIAFEAGLLIGADGQACLGNLGLDELSNGQRWVLKRMERIGSDIFHKWNLR